MATRWFIGDKWCDWAEWARKRVNAVYHEKGGDERGSLHALRNQLGLAARGRRAVDDVLVQAVDFALRNDMSGTMPSACDGGQSREE